MNPNMNPHVTGWLAAYHDGELPPARQLQVEQHLNDCPTCRAELDSLDQLSSFLKADPVPPHTPAPRFAAQVQLRLPRASLPPMLQNAGQPPRWALAIPLALIIVWAFLQAAIFVTAFIFTAGNVLGPGTAFFSNWLGTTSLFETGAYLLLFNTVLLVGIAILWSAWMALWLAWLKNQKEVSINGVAS
jgi:anti-sigma factor RsiW